MPQAYVNDDDDDDDDDDGGGGGDDDSSSVLHQVDHHHPHPLSIPTQLLLRKLVPSQCSGVEQLSVKETNHHHHHYHHHHHHHQLNFVTGACDS